MRNFERSCHVWCSSRGCNRYGTFLFVYYHNVVMNLRGNESNKGIKDSIDVTNLNRQFLFRQKDVGESKAETAAAFINQRCPWMHVTPHHCMIQDKDPSFYSSFTCIISGLDNIEARRWLKRYRKTAPREPLALRRRSIC